MPDRDLLNYAYLQGTALGRKFDASDVTRDAKLTQAARLYAATYKGTFEYMRDMAHAVTVFGQLTPAQAKGTLNCLMADARHRLEAKHAVKPVTVADVIASARFAGLSKVVPGRYRVEMPTGTLAVLIEPARDERKGMAIKTRTADMWLFQGTVSRTGVPDLLRRAPALLPAALDVLRNADNALVYGLSYAMHGSQCFICGRALDTAESLSVGYGPVCADKHGLPWGAKAVPAKVLLARAGQVQQPAAPVATGGRSYAEIFGDAA